MIGPVGWERVLREKRLRKGRQEVERHLMALHDACFGNELWKWHSAIVGNNHSVTQKSEQTERTLAGQAIALSHEHALITRGEKQGHPMPRWEVHLVFTLIQVESVYVHMGRGSVSQSFLIGQFCKNWPEGNEGKWGRSHYLSYWVLRRQPGHWEILTHLHGSLQRRRRF